MRCTARAWPPALALLLTLLLPAPALAVVTLTVTLDKSVAAAPVSGRLVVSLIGPGSSLPKDTRPIQAPFDRSPQPMYGLTVTNLIPGQSVTLDDTADSFPVKLSILPPGEYKAQAFLIVSRRTTDWKNTPGNLFTPDVTTFRITGDAKVPASATLVLTEATKAPEVKPAKGYEVVEIESALLTAFHQRPIMLRAAVIIPEAARGIPRDKAPALPAVYEVTGFGGDFAGQAARVARSLATAAPASPQTSLAMRAFWIVLDADSPSGHTLFADSANNGPWGAALTTELIPELERRYNLIPQPSARLLRGHSSGGWSVIWLALTYPQTFGAAWSSAPDPVDFRKFQNVNLYEAKNVFADERGNDRGSLRRGSRVLMTVRQEAAMENIIGPNLTSGAQWASWQAVFGPRDKDGKIVPMFDPITGDVNTGALAHYRAYDISARLAAEPDKFLPAFRDRIRIVCGTEDSYYLNEAVDLLRTRLIELSRTRDAFKDMKSWTGYIKLVPGDHGSVLMSPAIRAFPEEMVAELTKHGHLPAPIPAQTPAPTPVPAPAPAK